MIQEYLFVSEENKGGIKSLNMSDDAELIIEDIDNSECWIAKICMPGENEKTAISLSKIDGEIIEKYNPVVLSSECSAYFNKSIFPLINEFERKLRKLLYVASALHPDRTFSDNIQDIESKDFGEIFGMLFNDMQFIKGVREQIRNKSKKFTKAEITSFITNIPENTLWDQLLGENCVSTLRNNFNEVRDNRNDVMHAHNISYNKYKKSKKLFKNINHELDAAIGNYIKITENHTTYKKENPDFNKILNNALKSMHEQVFNDNYQSFISTIQEQLGEYFIPSIQLKPEVKLNLNQFEQSEEIQTKIADALMELDKIKERFSEHEIIVMPEFSNLQRFLSSLDKYCLEKGKINRRENDGEDENGVN